MEEGGGAAADESSVLVSHLIGGNNHGMWRKHVALTSVENEAEQSCNQIGISESPTVFNWQD